MPAPERLGPLVPWAGDPQTRVTISSDCDLDHSCTPSDVVALVEQRSSIMPALFDMLYHEYCRARLDEMRSQLLLRPGPVTEADLQGDSIAEQQAFEAGRSPRAVAQGQRFPDAGIHFLEAR
jgi:hypothetical protein